jgi:hypothetical protein
LIEPALIKYFNSNKSGPISVQAQLPKMSNKYPFKAANSDYEFTFFLILINKDKENTLATKSACLKNIKFNMLT